MRKIYKLFSIGLLCTSLFVIAEKADAALEIGTEYKFNCNYQLIDQSYASQLLGGEFTFTVTSSNNYNSRVTNFVVPDSETDYGYIQFANNGNGTYNLPQRINMSKQLGFSTVAGVYPFEYLDNGNWTQDYYITFTVDDDGNITMPDFTVIKYNDNNHTASIVAKYSNVVITKAGSDVGGGGGGGETPEPFNAVGTHEFNYFKTDYTNPNASVTSQEILKLVINEDNQYTEIGGFPVNSTLIEYGYDQGTVRSNSWTVDLSAPFNVIDIDFETGAGIFVYGPNIDGEDGPETGSQLVLSYNNGEYSLSDFTIWQKTYETTTGETDEEGNVSSETETKWTLLCKWSSQGVASEPALILNDATVLSVGPTSADIQIDYTAVNLPENVSIVAMFNDDAKDYYFDTVLTQPSVIKIGGFEENTSYNVTLALYAFEGTPGVDGNIIAMSEETVLAIKTIATPSIELTSAEVVSYSGRKAQIKIEYNAQNVPEDAIIYASYVDFENEIYEMDEILESPSYYMVTGLQEGKSYNFTVSLFLFQDTTMIAESNEMNVSFKTSGISSIGSENGNVRYFNLQGVEIAKPEKGEILIKIENGKAYKVIE